MSLVVKIGKEVKSQPGVHTATGTVTSKAGVEGKASVLVRATGDGKAELVADDQAQKSVIGSKGVKGYVGQVLADVENFEEGAELSFSGFSFEAKSEKEVSTKKGKR